MNTLSCKAATLLLSLDISRLQLLNPENFVANTLKLDDTNYLQFTPGLGVATNLYFETFQIQTNYALTPIDDI
jgi:hypothetical protein